MLSGLGDTSGRGDLTPGETALLTELLERLSSPASTPSVTNTGPLAGVKVIELGGIGPGPHAAMVLADLGADVVRVRRPGGLQMPAEDVDLLHRGKRIVDLDVKKEPQAAAGPGRQGRRAARLFPARHLRTARHRARRLRGGQPAADLRPDHRLGPGRAAGEDRRPRHQLPVADRALSAIGYRDRPPVAPLNLVADFGGGSMFVLLGIVAALYERERSGKGQVIDAAMVDGVSILAQMMWTMKSTGSLKDERESFMLDGGAPFYRTYETSDGKYMAVGAIEPQFFAQLLAGLGLSTDDVPNQFDPAAYPRDAQALRRAGSRARPATSGPRSSPAPTRASHPCSPGAKRRRTNTSGRARRWWTANGVDQAAPAPRFSRTPSGPVGAPPQALRRSTKSAGEQN